MKTRRYSKRSRVEAPAEEVFRWHARPGALERLSPPWERPENKTEEPLEHDPNGTAGPVDGADREPETVVQNDLLLIMAGIGFLVVVVSLAQLIRAPHKVLQFIKEYGEEMKDGLNYTIGYGQRVKFSNQTGHLVLKW